MKIAFLTNALEHGKDGVGDYTRALAQQCAREGDECALLGLNDSWVFPSENDVRKYLQSTDEAKPMICARFSSTQSWPERIEGAQKVLSEFKPDWISLQFVPYGFAPRGIVFSLCKYLPLLTSQACVHWMFHELWIGSNAGALLKEKIAGALQRASVLRLYKHLQPQQTHSSNELYLQRLARCGIEARLLPMFGAIPPLRNIVTLDDKWLEPFLSEAGLAQTSLAKSERDKELWLGFFGSLHPIWPPEPLLSRVEKACRQAGKEPVLISIGRLGPGESLWREMQTTYRGRFRFLSFGEQSVARVAQLFGLLDAGIAASPLGLLGKSSSAAAMLEHQLPLIVNREDVALPQVLAGTENAAQRALLLRLDDAFEARLMAPRALRNPASGLPVIAAQFRRDLQLSETGTH